MFCARYLRALTAMYIRMTFPAVEVYELLEPLLKDYRKLRLRNMSTCSIPILTCNLLRCPRSGIPSYFYRRVCRSVIDGRARMRHNPSASNETGSP